MIRDVRARLLEAAEQEIAACGPARASLRAIARRVGVSHQATAHHFEDRAGLFTALATEAIDTLHDRTRAAIEAAEVVGGGQVIAAGAVYVEFAGSNPAMFDLMFRPELLRADDPDLTAAWQRHRGLMVDAVARAQATGWGATMSAEELSMIGWAAVHGLAVLQRGEQAALLYPDVDLDQVLVRVGHAFGVLVAPAT